MSQSTDAILFYGYCWSDEFEHEDDEFPEQKWDKALDVSGENEPVEADFHCSDGCSIPYICVLASRTTANRGYPERIDVSFLSRQEELAKEKWDGLLDEFCARFGLTSPVNQQPQWWLVSWRG